MDKKERGETWVGYRPSIINVKKKDKKRRRQKDKEICREAKKEC